MRFDFLLVGGLVGVCALYAFWAGLKQRHVDIWFWSHLKHQFGGKPRKPDKGPVHLMFCFVDHYEPLVGKASPERGLERVEKWVRCYPPIADSFRDADGCAPKHSFFYPAEEYRPEYLDHLAKLCAKGYGEVEVHLHHRHDTTSNFKATMGNFVSTLRNRHGLLGDWKGQVSFSFIHGNWALDNSRPDRDWCGLDNEITLLRELNCYADFTFPSAPSDTQTRTINDIYYATDDPNAAKSHDVGVSVTAGGNETGDLLLVQGPLTLNWNHRRLGIWPKVENGDFSPSDVPLKERIDLWVRQGVHVKGRPEWIIVKIHTHGADDIISDYMFDQGGFRTLCQELQKRYNDGKTYQLHYVSARECFNIIKAAQAGHSDNPNQYRNFEVSSPDWCAMSNQ